MNIDSTAAIAGMALVTYLLRAGGVWLAKRVPPNSRTELLLQNLPACVLISIVAPAALQHGVSGVAATLTTILVMARTRSLLLATLSGILFIFLLRAWT